MEMEMILAFCDDRGIGSHGSQPWPHIKNDMAWFRRNTLGKRVFLSSEVFEGIGRCGLPYRDTYVITTRPEHYMGRYAYDPKFVSEDYAMDLVRYTNVPTIFVGGSRRFLPMVRRIYLTIVEFTSAFCDRFLDMDLSGFGEVYSESNPPEGFPCTFKVLERTE